MAKKGYQRRHPAVLSVYAKQGSAKSACLVVPGMACCAPMGDGADSGRKDLAAPVEQHARLSLGQIFTIFFKAGCAFGGGLGVLALLQEQLVTLRRILPDKELLTLWSIGRIMPSGTMTAVAVAVGHRLAGFPGTLVALVAMILPGFLCVIALTIAYGWFAHGPVLEYINATLLPAALGIVVVSAFRLGRPMFKPSFELVFVIAGFGGAILPGMNPALVIVAGGVVGAVLLHGKQETGR